MRGRGAGGAVVRCVQTEGFLGRLSTPVLEAAKGKPAAGGEDQCASGPGGESRPFPDEIPIRFGVPDASQHHHLPLRIAPFGCSTRRGRKAGKS